MQNKIIISIIIILLVIGVAIFFYYYYELPKKVEPSELIQINIEATAKGKQVETGFLIGLNSFDTPYGNGETSKNGFTAIMVPINSTIFIWNNNTLNQTYYTDYSQLDTYNPGPHRISLDLYEPIIPSVVFEGSMVFGEPITVSLYSTQYLNTHFCVRWSTHFIRVTPSPLESYTKISKPEGYTWADTCYATNQSLIQEHPQQEIVFEYKSFGLLDERDYIRFTFFDKDALKGFNPNTAVNKTFILSPEELETIKSINNI